MTLDICYEDQDLLITNKPAGLLCVPGLSDPDNLYDRVLAYNPNARVVHRLDMATSGLVIFALHHACQKKLGYMFEKKQIEKTYIAIVAGRVPAEQGEVVSPLICDWEKRPKQKVDWLGGKLSHTLFQTIERSNNASRIKLFPITGRTHQLRLHMEQIGHPILGDKLYRHEGINDEPERLLLHAYRLILAHPMTGKVLKVEAQPGF